MWREVMRVDSLWDLPCSVMCLSLPSSASWVPQNWEMLAFLVLLVFPVRLLSFMVYSLPECLISLLQYLPCVRLCSKCFTLNFAYEIACEIETIITLVASMRKLRIRKVRELVRDHTAGNVCILDLKGSGWNHWVYALVWVLQRNRKGRMEIHREIYSEGFTHVISNTDKS